MTARSEARLEVDSRGAAAGSSWMSCSVARTANFAGCNIWEDNKASSRAPEAGAAGAGRSSRRDSGDMADNASGASLVENSRAGGDAAHICRAVSVLNRHLETRRKRRQRSEEKRK